jgi:hypothetical protein
MMDKNSETSFTDLEQISKKCCFVLVTGLVGVNTGVGNDNDGVLVCNVFHKHVIGVSYYIRLCRTHFRAVISHLAQVFCTRLTALASNYS